MGSLYGQWVWTWWQPEQSSMVCTLWGLDHTTNQLRPDGKTGQPAELLQSVWLAQRNVRLAAGCLEPVCPSVNAQFWGAAPCCVYSGRGGHPDPGGGLRSESKRRACGGCNLWILWASTTSWAGLSHPLSSGLCGVWVQFVDSLF